MYTCVRQNVRRQQIESRYTNTKTYVVFHGRSKGGGRDKKGDKNGRGKLHHGG